MTDDISPLFMHTSPGLWEKLKPLARQMRCEPTHAENVLWQQIRGRKLHGLKFRRQHAIDRFIVDFFCHEFRLIIEVDGEIHDYTPQEDALRQEFLEASGYGVLRFTNDAVLQQIDSVLEHIIDYVRHTTGTPSPFGEGDGG